MNNNTEYIMEAVFTKKEHDAIVNGDAMFNNGFRSKKGNYWAQQPEFREMKKADNLIKTKLAGAAVDIGVYLIVNTIVPRTVQFFNEQLYPYLTNAFKKATNKHQCDVVHNESTDILVADRKKLIHLADYKIHKSAGNMK